MNPQFHPQLVNDVFGALAVTEVMTAREGCSAAMSREWGTRGSGARAPWLWAICANCSASNHLDRIVELARDADIVFAEAAFVDEDAEAAALRRRLTARLAGSAAGRAGVQRLVPFHFSPRYARREEDVRRQAEAAYREALSRQASGKSTTHAENGAPP